MPHSIHRRMPAPQMPAPDTPNRVAAKRAPLPSEMRTGLLACLAAGLALAGAPYALAIDGDRFLLNAGSTLTYDDNLARLPSSQKARGDEILSTDVGGSAHLTSGLQTYDGNIDFSRVFYSHFGQQDYSALAFSGTAATEIGTSGRAALTLSQNQTLAPLANFQALVRDVITSRTARLDGSYGINGLWTLEGYLNTVHATNSFAPEDVNDINTNAESLGLAYSLADQNRIGLRETVTGANFANKAPQLTNGVISLYDPGYIDRNFELYGTYTLTPITTLTGDFGVSNRTFHLLSETNYTGVIGTVSVDINDGGPLTYGSTVRRILGGQAVLASRVVLTESINPHFNYAISEFFSAHGSMDLARRRYSVDAPGYPAHREYESIFVLGMGYKLQRYVRLGFDWTADSRRADPETFSFNDHRYVLSANFTL